MTGDLGLSPIKKEPKRVIYSHRSSHPEAVGSDCTVNLRPSSSWTSSAATAERLCAKKLDGNRSKIDDWSMSLSHCAFISQEYCEYLHISHHLTSICIKKGIVIEATGELYNHTLFFLILMDGVYRRYKKRVS